MLPERPSTTHPIPLGVCVLCYEPVYYGQQASSSEPLHKDCEGPILLPPRTP